MGWLSDIGDKLWGDSATTSSVDSAFPGGFNDFSFGGSGGDNNSISAKTGSDSLFTPGFFGDIIKAGAGLAGTYYTLDANKQANDAQIQMAKDKLAAELAAAKAKGGGKGGGGAGAALQIAKMNNLSALYQNWGQIVEKGGEAAAESAQVTGKMGQDPIIARLAALR